MSVMALGEQRWWLETWRHLGGDSGRARVLRATGDGLSEGPFWNLVHAELVMLGASRAERSELHGRLALATLLQVVLRVAPRELGPLVQTIASRERVADFTSVAHLAGPMSRVLETFRRLLAPGDEDVMQALAAQGEIVVWDPAASGADPAARKEQGRYILAYRDAAGGLREQRIGVVAASRWAVDATMKARLERVGGRLEPRVLFTDLISVGVLAALRFRIKLAARGLTLPIPDVRAFLASTSQIELALLEHDEPAAPGRTPDAPPAEPAAPAKVSIDSVVMDVERERVDPQPEEWLVAAQQWARDRPARLEALFEVATRLESSRLWPQLANDAARFAPSRALRPQEAARVALATLLDEAFRTLPPRDYMDLLDALAVDAEEIVRAAHSGELWAVLEPLFVSWARQLDPEVDPQDKGLVIRTLSRFGDILPWDDGAKGSPEKRRKNQDAAIDAVYSRGDKEPAVVRRAVFWCATRARNDQVHRNADSLTGQVRSSELLTDVTALAIQATLRYRVRRAEDANSQPSVPSIGGLSGLLAKLWGSRKR